MKKVHYVWPAQPPTPPSPPRQAHTLLRPPCNPPPPLLPGHPRSCLREARGPWPPAPFVVGEATSTLVPAAWPLSLPGTCSPERSEGLGSLGTCPPCVRTAGLFWPCAAR